MQKEPNTGSRKPRREFAWIRSKTFTGWACKGCGWVQPELRFAPGDKTPLQAAKQAFDEHKCKDYGRVSMCVRSAAMSVIR